MARVQTAYSLTANTQTKVAIGVQDSYTMIVKAVTGLKTGHTTVVHVQFDSNLMTRGRVELHRIAMLW